MTTMMMMMMMMLTLQPLLTMLMPMLTLTLLLKMMMQTLVLMLMLLLKTTVTEMMGGLPVSGAEPTSQIEPGGPKYPEPEAAATSLPYYEFRAVRTCQGSACAPNTCSRQRYKRGQIHPQPDIALPAFLDGRPKTRPQPDIALPAAVQKRRKIPQAASHCPQKQPDMPFHTVHQSGLVRPKRQELRLRAQSARGRGSPSAAVCGLEGGALKPRGADLVISIPARAISRSSWTSATGGASSQRLSPRAPSYQRAKSKRS